MLKKWISAFSLVGMVAMGQVVMADQVVGTENLGVSVTEDQLVAFGRSVTREVLHKTVYNDHHQKLGVIEDVILSPEDSASYAVVDIGSFLGIPRHPVLVKFALLKHDKKDYILSGASKDAMKHLPKFHYNPADK